MKKLSAFRPIVFVLVLMGLLLIAPAAGAHPRHHPAKKLTPMIFVHGGAGSGAQFASQAQRFTSNGYPDRLIRVVEYDSTFSIDTREDVYARLDALIAELKEKTGRPRVDLLGHSLGTTLSHEYLASPERAANVAHYVNIDGRTASTPPGGVPTLAIWAGRGTPGRAIDGATNVTIDNQTHVQVATSAETFKPIYRFFTGRDPRKDIAREHSIRLAGRAQLFPQNSGVGDRTLEIWRVHAATGKRKGRRPVARLDVAEDGSWGPVRAKRGKRYEFALVQEGENTHHIYYEPFERSDHLVRLLTSEPNGGVNLLIERSPNHSALVLVRYKEFWGDQGAENDELKINGTNVINAATAPIGERVIGMFAFDAGSDGVSNVATPHPVFISLPFLSGVDLFIPAAAPPTETVSVSLRSRGAGRIRTVNVPNFPSSTDSVSVNLNDFESGRSGKH